METKVGRSGGGECAYASVASPPKMSYPWDAAKAKNILCMGCSTHEEYVEAMA